MGTTIKRAKPGDAAILAELNKEFNEREMPLAVVKARLAKPGRETVFLARTAGKAVGYACAQHSRSFCYPRP